MNPIASNLCPHTHFTLLVRQNRRRCSDCGEYLDNPHLSLEELMRTAPATAQEFLNSAEVHMGARATTYDADGGERSMTKTIEIFNTLRGASLTETEGWLLMTILKLVRANQGKFKSDNYEDLVAYSALMGESASSEARQQQLKA